MPNPNLQARIPRPVWDWMEAKAEREVCDVQDIVRRALVEAKKADEAAAPRARARGAKPKRRRAR